MGKKKTLVDNTNFSKDIYWLYEIIDMRNVQNEIITTTKITKIWIHLL